MPQFLPIDHDPFAPPDPAQMKTAEQASVHVVPQPIDAASYAALLRLIHGLTRSYDENTKLVKEALALLSKPKRIVRGKDGKISHLAIADDEDGES